MNANDDSTPSKKFPFTADDYIEFHTQAEQDSIESEPSRPGTTGASGFGYSARDDFTDSVIIDPEHKLKLKACKERAATRKEHAAQVPHKERDWEVMARNRRIELARSFRRAVNLEYPDWSKERKDAYVLQKYRDCLNRNYTEGKVGD